jgi:hypothetical protein
MDQNIFWLDNPSILLKKYYQIIPNKKMNITTFYNTITRILLYLIIIVYFFLNNIKLILIFIIIIFYIIMIYYNDNHKIIIKKKEICRDSTINNPMANPYVIGSKLDIKACNNLDNSKVIDNLRFNVYEDSNRLNNIKILERSYYTLPVTDYPNNINLFINELYKITNKTCKKNAQNCESYRDLRFIR